MKEYEFDQYKIFIESAEKSSEKRISQNNIYLTINLAFLSYVLFQNPSIKETLVTSFIGVVICVIWLLTIINYCKRNKVKYDIINEKEEKFGSLYKEEWKRISVLTPLSTYEKILSIVFMLIYIIIPILKFVIK
ncbi:MAG: hypothetical protein ACI4U4_05325 [Bacilli bacterium]